MLLISATSWRVLPSAYSHGSFKAASWDHVPILLGTFTGAVPSELSLSHPHAFFRLSVPGLHPSGRYCGLQFKACLFAPCLSPFLECKFHRNRECARLITFVISEFGIWRSLSVHLLNVPPLLWSLPWFPQSQLVSLSPRHLSSLSFLLTLYMFTPEYLTHVEKYVKYMYRLTSNFKANTHLIVTQDKTEDRISNLISVSFSPHQS